MKIKNNTVVKRLFAAYQNGNLQNGEKELIDNWFNNHTGASHDVFTSEAEESRIHNELTNRLSVCINGKPIRSLWYQSVWLKAACVIAVVGAVALPMFKNNHQSHFLSAQITYHTINTQNGQIKQILLDDGTRIWLNSASRLRYALSFNTAKQRTVYLDRGEAYFEVKHDVKHPFKVLSGNFQTTVLGTSFNISAYHPQKEYKVAVASGMVSVGITGKNGQYRALSNGLTKGRVLNYHTLQKRVAISKSSTGSPFAWISGGDINIDGLNLQDVGEELARTYNLKVAVTHPDYDTVRFTMSLNRNDLGLALKQLTLTTGVSYKLENNHLTIKPQKPLMK